MGDYRKLKVWQRSRALEQRIHKLIDELPIYLRNDAREQLGDAASSVRRNIAEGAGLNTDALFAKHLRYALGSANEVQDELDSLQGRNLIGKEDQDLIPETTEIRAMLASLHETVRKDIEAQKQARRRSKPRRGKRRKS